MLDLDHIEPVEEGFPKLSLFYRFFQIRAGGRDDSDIGLPCHGFADPLKFPVLEESHELRLKGEGQIADFIEKEGSPFARGNPARIVPDCAR